MKGLALVLGGQHGNVLLRFRQKQVTHRIQIKTQFVLHCGGAALQDIFFTLEGNLSRCDDVVQALTTYYQPSTNIPHERHLFRSMTQLPEKTTK